MTRAGILGALELGLHSLRGYLQRVCQDDTDAKERYLEFILAEQFFLCYNPRGDYVAMDPHVTLALLELDVDPTLPLMKKPPDVGCGVIRQIHLAENSDTQRLWMIVLDLFIKSGATLGSKALATAVEIHDISLLQYLISCTANLAEEGREALAWAASRNDFEAVDLLLQAGVDINCYVQGDTKREDEPSLTILAYAINTESGIFRRVGDQKTASYEMMKYLIENGAVPKALPDDWHPCHFLQFLLRYTEAGFEILQKVQYIMETFDIDFGDPSTPSDGLLEACLWGTLDFSDDDSRERLATFEYLLQKFPVCIGASLAPLIMRGGQQQLILDVIGAGADIHAYSFSGDKDFGPNGISPLQAAAWRGDEQLVRQLLDLGVEVDGKPLPDGAATALECICRWTPLTSEEGLRRLRIIQTLLSHGAEVNASGNAYGGCTALHQAVAQGALDVTTLLLRHGANVNVTSDAGESALDIAADYGRIDIAQFLLNGNAVSCRPGKTGYDGAIQLARERGHFALADVIVKHAENNLGLGIVVPSLSSRHEHRREVTNYGLGSDGGVSNLQPLVACSQSGTDTVFTVFI